MLLALLPFLCVILSFRSAEVGAGSFLTAELGGATQHLVEALIFLVRENYILEERIVAIETGLRKGLEQGDYHRLSDPWKLASRLTEDLRESSSDLHFGVRPRPDSQLGDTVALPEAPTNSPEPAFPPLSSGIGRIAVLEGNIGYLEVKAFADPKVGGPAADAAFKKLADTAALIVDVRNSRGGHPGMVAHLFSYFFDGEPHLFNRFYWRNSGKDFEFWTVADLLSPPYTDRQVFILTSRSSASAPEGFTYHLKHANRAIVIGEPTAGAAHTTQTFSVGDFQVAIPTGRPVSSITGGNWEATGVIPDREVPSEEALAVAHYLAIEQLIANAVEPDKKAPLQEILMRLAASG